jgi:hypothetical protein
MSDSKYRIEFPDYFDSYIGELEAKGYFADLVIHAAGRRYRPTFYDPIRLGQEVKDALSAGAVCFSEANLVIVDKISRDALEAAVAQLSGQDFVTLVPDPSP